MSASIARRSCSSPRRSRHERAAAGCRACLGLRRPSDGTLANDPPPGAAREEASEVLEIGVGSGANFIHYDATRVTKLYALEPNLGMIRLAKRQASHTKLNIEYLDLPGERIPLDDGTVDTVVSTFTLCTISGIKDAIQGIARILKPEGKLIFFELGLSHDSKVQWQQKQLEPVSRLLFEGLYLTRNIPSLITQYGFQIKQMEMGYLAQFPKLLTYCWWGIAELQQEHNPISAI